MTPARRGIAGIMGGMDTGSFEDTRQCLHRIRLFRSGAHRAHRPQAGHHLRRALSLRARRGPAIRAAGLELCTRSDPGMVRRRGHRDVVIAGELAAAAQADPVRSGPGRTLGRHRRAARRGSLRILRGPGLCGRRLTASCMWCRPAGAMTWTAPPTWWKKWCAFTAWPMCRRWRWRAPSAVATPVLVQGAAPHPHRAPCAGGARLQ